MTDKFAAEWDVGIASQRHKGRRIGTLWAEEDTGGGDCTLAQWFLDETWLFRADVLQEVIGLLRREYEKAMTDAHKQATEIWREKN